MTHVEIDKGNDKVDTAGPYLAGVETVSTQRGSGTQRSYHASDEARRVPLRKVRPEPHVNSWTLAELGRQREVPLQGSCMP